MGIFPYPSNCYLEPPGQPLCELALNAMSFRDVAPQFRCSIPRPRSGRHVAHRPPAAVWRYFERRAGQSLLLSLNAEATSDRAHKYASER